MSHSLKSSSTNVLGFWSGVLAAVSALVYAVPQLLIGIELPSTPQDLVLILLPSFFIVIILSMTFKRGLFQEENK